MSSEAKHLATKIIDSLVLHPNEWKTEETGNGDELQHEDGVMVVSLMPTSQYGSGDRCNFYLRGSVDVWLPKVERIAVRAAVRRLLAIKTLEAIG